MRMSHQRNFRRVTGVSEVIVPTVHSTYNIVRYSQILISKQSNKVKAFYDMKPMKWATEGF